MLLINYKKEKIHLQHLLGKKKIYKWIHSSNPHCPKVNCIHVRKFVDLSMFYVPSVQFYPTLIILNS